MQILDEIDKYFLLIKKFMKNNLIKNFVMIIFWADDWM